MKNRLCQLKSLAVAALAFASFAIASSGQAATINVDFNTANSPTQTGAAVIGAAGDVWNASTSGNFTGQALLNSNGSASGVTMDVNAASVFDAGNDTVFNGSPVQPLMEDFLYNFGGTNTVTLHNLTPGAYDLYVYSVGDHLAGNGVQNRISDFNANGVLATVGPNAGAGTLTSGANYDLIPVTVGANGLLTIAVSSGVPGDTGQFNGFQLEAVPEPTSIAALASLCVVGFILGIKRCRAA